MNKAKEHKALANGAKAIKKAEAEAKAKAAKPEPLAIPKVIRPIQDILKDRVTVLDGHIGLKIADDTPLEESLQIFDWVTSLSNHVGFMIGDVLNFGQSKWGEKYTQALNQTGRAISTLSHYASVSARIAPKDRKAELSFSHHELILRTSAEVAPKLLADTAKQAEKGCAPTIKELRAKVAKFIPRKKKAPKKATSGKGKKRKKGLIRQRTSHPQTNKPEWMWPRLQHKNYLMP